MYKTIWFTATVLLVAIMMVFTGCPTTDKEDNVVHIFGAFVDVDADRFNASVADFEERTGIDIVYEGSGDFESLVVIRAEGGDPPNIAAFPQPGLMFDLANRGLVIPTTDLDLTMGFLEQQYSDAWLSLAALNGTVYGVPYRGSMKSLVWYAKPIFEKENYQIPQTWDELLSLSQQMVNDGYIPWSIGIESAGATGWVATDWVEDIMLRTTSPENYDRWVRGELKFNSPEVRRALEILSEIWFNESFVLGGRNSILTVPFGDAATPLVTDPPRALMHRQATFISGFLPEDAQAQIGTAIDVFYLPPIDAQYGRPVLGAGDFFAAMKDTPATREVLKFLATGESIKAWVEAGGTVATHNDASLSWYPGSIERSAAEFIRDADTFRFDGSDLMPGEVGAGTFWTGMVDYVSGEDLDSVLDKIDNSYPR